MTVDAGGYITSGSHGPPPRHFHNRRNVSNRTDGGAVGNPVPDLAVTNPQTGRCLNLGCRTPCYGGNCRGECGQL